MGKIESRRQEYWIDIVCTKVLKLLLDIVVHDRGNPQQSGDGTCGLQSVISILFLSFSLLLGWLSSSSSKHDGFADFDSLQFFAKADGGT